MNYSLSTAPTCPSSIMHGLHVSGPDPDELPGLRVRTIAGSALGIARNKSACLRPGEIVRGQPVIGGRLLELREWQARGRIKQIEGVAGVVLGVARWGLSLRTERTKSSATPAAISSLMQGQPRCRTAAAHKRSTNSAC